MRILYIQPAEGFGGAERQSVVHIKHLRALGHEVIPFVGPGRPIQTALEDAGIQDYVFSPHLPSDPPRPMSLWKNIRHHIGIFDAWRRTTRHATDAARAARGVDLVFASRPFGWTVGTFVARRLGVPIVWRAGTMPFGLVDHLSLRWLARLIKPDALVANARALALKLAPAIAVPSYVVHNGVDVDRFYPRRARPRFRSELGLLPETPVVGVAARPHPDKGFDLLAAVIARVSRRFPEMRVLVAGEDGWRGTLERRFVADGLGDRVTFLGHVRDIENFYRSCDVIALASKATGEVLSNSLLEAMAMERPVLATRVGGLHEVIVPGVHGFLSPPEDVDAYAHNLSMLLENDTLRRRMGVAGRATIVQSFNERAVVERLAGVLISVVRGTRERALANKASGEPREAL